MSLNFRSNPAFCDEQQVSQKEEDENLMFEIQAFKKNEEFQENIKENRKIVKWKS